MGVFVVLILSFSCFHAIFCAEESVIERNLLINTPRAQDILMNHDKFILGPNRTHVGVLGFIQDNELSYEKALIFAKKFNYLSPLWLNIERIGFGQYKITGFEKINKEWMQKLIGINSQIRIAPKITFKNWTMKDFLILSSSEQEWINLSQELSNFCEHFKIHGLVLDIFNDWYKKAPNNLIIGIIQEISARLRLNFFVSIISISRQYTNVHHFNKNLFEEIANYASAITLTTFNRKATFRIARYIKKIAPEEIFRDKIFFGVEFNGYETVLKDGKPTQLKNLIKNDYLKYLEDYNNFLVYDEYEAESYFDVSSSSKKKRIFYPSLFSLNERIDLANRLNVGIFVWSVGDGLDYFYELL